jgi:hypothetical protein
MLPEVWVSAEPPLPVVRRGFPGIRFHLSSASNRPRHYLASSELLAFSRRHNDLHIFQCCGSGSEIKFNDKLLDTV